MALKACRECGAQVSTSAATCPHCGVGNPAGSPSPQKGKRAGFGCLGIIVVLGGLIGIGALTEKELTPQERAEKQRKDAEFSADYDALVKAGALAVAVGDANKYEISGWNSSLDLYIGTRSELRAASLSGTLCRSFFKQPLKSSNWKIRVYMVDGSVGAECSIR